MTPIPPGSFLAWQDDRRGATPATRIAGAVACYLERCGVPPTVALTHPEETADVAGLAVRGATHVRRGNVWVGREDA